jgi:hypothetical protein
VQGIYGLYEPAQALAVEVAFERLPRDITREKLSSLGWPEERLHHVASFVGAFGGGDGGPRARRPCGSTRRPSASGWRYGLGSKMYRP